MADIIDEANDNAERDLQRAIAAARSNKPPEPNGACLYCDEAVGPGRRYCDADCAADHERERRIRARQVAR